MSESRRPPAIEPTGIFEGLRPGAILTGIIVDNVATFVSGLVLVFLFAARVASQHRDDFSEESLEALGASPEFLVASLILGLLCTVLGAYVGAKRAACFYVRHGAWIAVGSTIVAFVLYAIQGQDEPRPPLWFDVVGFALIIPAGVAGGLLAQYLPVRRAT